MDAEGVEKRGQVPLAAEGCGKGQAAHHRWHGQGQVDQEAHYGAAAAELLHPQGQRQAQYERKDHGLEGGCH